MNNSSENLTFITTSQGPNNYGIAFPVVEGTGGFFTKTNGLETILSGFKQLLLTNPGERVMNPRFGAGLRKYVFEPSTPDLPKKIEREVTESLLAWAPNVIIKGLHVSVNSPEEKSGHNSVLVSLKVAMKDDLTSERILDLIL